MVETGNVEKDGNQIGFAADLGTGPLGWEWWAVASGVISNSLQSKQTANFFASAATVMQVTGSIKAYGEQSSATFLPLGINLTATTPLVVTVDVMPGPKISYDSVKLELTTNRAYINSLCKVKLGDAEARQAVASCKAVLSEAKKMRTSLSSSALRAEVTQLVQA